MFSLIAQTVITGLKSLIEKGLFIHLILNLPILLSPQKVLTSSRIELTPLFSRRDLEGVKIFQKRQFCPCGPFQKPWSPSVREQAMANAVTTTDLLSRTLSSPSAAWELASSVLCDPVSHRGQRVPS